MEKNQQFGLAVSLPCILVGWNRLPGWGFLVWKTHVAEVEIFQFGYAGSLHNIHCTGKVPGTVDPGIMTSQIAPMVVHQDSTAKVLTLEDYGYLETQQDTNTSYIFNANN